MSRSPWNFSTAVPVSRLRGDERNGLLGGGGDGGLMELTLDRGDELGEVGVADDAPELSLGFEHPRGGPARHMSPDCQCLTLRLVRRTHSIIDSHGFVLSSVFFRLSRIP